MRPAPTGTGSQGHGGQPALQGIRVVALEAVAAGPFCTRILADMGAEVVKIERPGTGDPIREWDGAVRGLSSGYVWVNRNKRSVCLDLKRESGATAARRLAEGADVVVQNLAPGVAEGLGMGSISLRRTNPRLIYCSLSGYGDDGPYRDRKAFDLLVQGESGLIATTGHPGNPAKVSVPIGDLTAGLYAALGVVLALFQREHTGEGQHVDVAMFDSLLSLLGYFPHHVWHRGEEPGRAGMRHHYVVPYGPFPARDGRYVNLAVGNPQAWRSFCHHVLRMPRLAEEPRFSTTEMRRQHRGELEGLIEELFQQEDSREWLHRLDAAGLPYGEVRGVTETLAHPVVAARRLVREVDSPVGRVPVIASPLRLASSQARYDRIPALGEDTEALLAEAGYERDDLARLREEGAIG